VTGCVDGNWRSAIVYVRVCVLAYSKVFANWNSDTSAVEEDGFKTGSNPKMPPRVCTWTIVVSLTPCLIFHQLHQL
jgi:hypothetical protein